MSASRCSHEKPSICLPPIAGGYLRSREPGDAPVRSASKEPRALFTTSVSTDLVALHKALGGGWELTYRDPKAKLPPLVAAGVPPGPIPAGGPGAPALPQ